MLLHKRGDTFKLIECQLTDDEKNVVNLADIDIASQIRDMYGKLIVELAVEKADDNLSYTLTGEDEASWPLGDAEMDIQYTQDGEIFSTETIPVIIIKDITRPVGD